MVHILPPAGEAGAEKLNFYREALEAALKKIEEFALAYGYQEHARERFMDVFEIFDRKEAFDDRVIEVLNLPDATRLMKTACAALEKRRLLAVTPELYLRIYPEGGDEAFAYEKLLAHELAHRLHIRILHGDEEAMGPVWFFEGFATYAAGQFETGQRKETPARLLVESIHSKERGSYHSYNSIFKKLLAEIPMDELIETAATDGFACVAEKIILKAG